MCTASRSSASGRQDSVQGILFEHSQSWAKPACYNINFESRFSCSSHIYFFIKKKTKTTIGNHFTIVLLQIMELSENYTPEISEFKVRIVRSERVKIK